MPVYLEVVFNQPKAFNLASTLTSGAVVLTPPSYVGYPSGNFQAHAVCENEYILVRFDTTPWTILRHREGSSAASHPLGAPFFFDRLTAEAAANLIGADQAGTLIATGQEFDFSGDVTVSQSGAKIGVVVGASGTERVAPDFKVTGLTGATAVGRFVGATTSGAPVSGTFALADFIITRDGAVWICTVAGSPGTWVIVGTGLTNPMSAVGDLIRGSTAGAPARLAIGTTGNVLQVVGGLPVWGAPPPAFSSEVSAPDFTATGLTGATQSSRWVGATTSGAPVSGTFALGDVVFDQSATVWMCTVAGSPGTWKQVGGNPVFTSEVQALDVKVTGLTGAVTSSRWVGGTASGAPVSGTFLVGDFIVDASGSFYICTTAGSPGTWAQVSGSSGTFAGIVQGTAMKATGLTGAVAASRYVGAVASGHPSSGTFAIGDFSIDQTGSFWVCVTAGTPGTWVNVAGGGLSNPMTTTGDVIIGGSSGTPGRLPIGTAAQVLTVVSGVPAWAANPAGFADPMTTNGDLIVRTGGATTRLAKGSDLTVLSIDATTHEPKWNALPADVGFANPMTTKGDIIVGDTGGAPIRKAVGSNTQVLTADSTATGGIKWAAAAGGSGNAITRCAIGSEPGSPATGDMVVYTNAPYTATWTGSLWAVQGPVFPMTQPIDANFSWMNQGGASVDTTKGGVYLSVPSSAGDGFRGRVVAAPAAPYVVTAYIQPNMAIHGGGGHDQIVGFVWWDNAGTNFVAAGLYYNSGAGPPESITLLIVKYSGYTTYDSSYVLDHFGREPSRSWWQFGDDNTNRYINVSQDGQHWIRIWSVGRTDFITPNRVGFVVKNSSGTYDAGLGVLSWTGA